jgi:hypothetical protein
MNYKKFQMFFLINTSANFLFGRTKMGKILCDLGSGWSTVLKVTVSKCGFGACSSSFGAGDGPVAGSCKCGNGPSVSVKG